MRTGNLFVISGPSGAGKGTLVKRLLERVPDAWVSVSATTRDPRPGEQDGVHYYFIDKATFDAMVERDEFLEWAHVHTAQYGTPQKSVEEHIAQGQQVILEIDVQGAFAVKEKIPSAILVFIEPPSVEVLRERLVGRDSGESPEIIEGRMKIAEVELSRKKEYDYCLVNDNLETATDMLVDFVNSKAESE